MHHGFLKIRTLLPTPYPPKTFLKIKHIGQFDLSHNKHMDEGLIT